jgi:hypothetical protein
MSVDFQSTTQHYITEDRNIQVFQSSAIVILMKNAYLKHFLESAFYISSILNYITGVRVKQNPNKE